MSPTGSEDTKRMTILINFHEHCGAIPDMMVNFHNSKAAEKIRERDFYRNENHLKFLGSESMIGKTDSQKCDYYLNYIK